MKSLARKLLEHIHKINEELTSEPSDVIRILEGIIGHDREHVHAEHSAYWNVNLVGKNSSDWLEEMHSKVSSRIAGEWKDIHTFITSKNDDIVFNVPLNAKKAVVYFDIHSMR